LAALLAVLLSAGPALAQDEAGEPMTTEELRAFHAGREHAGCYLNRPEEPVWRERMAEDGRLYDLMKDGAEVGTWWVEKGGVVCFRYADRPPGPYCFTGRRRGPWRDFYSAYDGTLVTTTQCDGEPVA
jgi:hypothetical protein